MHVLGERLYVLHRCRRENAMAKIENVAGPSVGFLQDGVSAAQHPIEGREEQRRIEIALNRPAARISARIAAVPVPK